MLSYLSSDVRFLVQFLSAIFLAILFLQSGIDKVVDWKGNLSWLKGHFAKSPLKNMVPLLLAVITFFELSAGLSSALGVLLLMWGDYSLALLGALLSAASILMLFFGQRMAKDYEGAASLVAYFLVSLFALYMYAV